MRTTLDIDDRLLDAARALAADHGISVGAAVSRLIERGLRPQPPTGPTEGHSFPTFDVDPGAPPITLDLVIEHRDG